ncbi:uncharacterized protein LOC113868139 [Abrus precatorius]|uniref:Uncharacterized protein LOC113868139 n=1 Tax=Abrus precatorius TaxID=3816 RepID=A0A8B8LT90_ABRPR|nr:uncharacterized protein LOC113868139 [Abrus precatorius]
MKGTSKVIMGATLVMVVTLAVVLGLILVLLAELYCSLLLRRRQLKKTNSNTIPISTTPTTTTIPNASPSHAPHSQHSPPPPFSNIYSQGVLQAPTSFLFPFRDDMLEPMKHRKQEPKASPLSSFLARAPQLQEVQETSQGGASGSEVLCVDKSCCGGEHLVYISNPIYENEEGKESVANTPFETPNTSPSLSEKSGSSVEDDDHDASAKASPCGGAHSHSSPPFTPPLTPIKKLPAEACSVSLRDATSLGTSGSDSRSISAPSSSSSGSPCTSPSW